MQFDQQAGFRTDRTLSPTLAGKAEGTPVPTKQFMTVSELTNRIRGVLEPAFVQVTVQGEVSNYRPATSGHAYFSLKDVAASLSVASFGWGRRKNQAFDLKDGALVACRGKISVYPPRGNYQFIADSIEPLGSGALQIAYEKLKEKLALEGLFDGAKKKPLPKFPSRIVVITSPSGAAVQDILNIVTRRAPQVKVLILPALMQGDEAAGQVNQALLLANQQSLGDLVIIARGGGSIEDLWCFNHEGLARSIAASRLPIVSAIGHEIDFTIADFVSDLRAPTPSAAAEMVTAQWVEARHRVSEAKSQLMTVMRRDLFMRKSQISHLIPRLVSPKDRLCIQAQRIDELMHRMKKAMETILEKRKAKVGQQMGQLDALSPLRVLERGYTLIRDPIEKFTIYKSVAQIQSQQDLEITFHDGSCRVRTL